MPKGVYKRTYKTKRAISVSKREYFKTHQSYWKGKKIPIEARKKMSDAARKRIGKLNPFWGRKHTRETKLKIGLLKLGKKQSKETVLKRAIKLRGIPRTIEWRRKISEAQKGKKGNNWKGGKEKINKIIHHSIDYKFWRESVFKRDDWICQKCKKKSNKLHPHHIKGFAYYSELRFLIKNGVTLCINCHKEFHRLYGEGKYHYEHFNSWIKI